MLERQPEVAKDIGKQICGGSAIKGVMIESNLVEGGFMFNRGPIGFLHNRGPIGCLHNRGPISCLHNRGPIGFLSLSGPIGFLSLSGYSSEWCLF